MRKTSFISVSVLSGREEYPTASCNSYGRGSQRAGRRTCPAQLEAGDSGGDGGDVPHQQLVPRRCHRRRLHPAWTTNCFKCLESSACSAWRGLCLGLCLQPPWQDRQPGGHREHEQDVGGLGGRRAAADGRRSRQFQGGRPALHSQVLPQDRDPVRSQLSQCCSSLHSSPPCRTRRDIRQGTWHRLSGDLFCQQLKTYGVYRLSTTSSTMCPAQRISENLEQGPT